MATAPDPGTDLTLVAAASAGFMLPGHPLVIRVLQLGPLVSGLALLLALLTAPIRIDGVSSIVLAGVACIASGALALASDVYVFGWRRWRGRAHTRTARGGIDWDAFDQARERW